MEEIKKFIKMTIEVGVIAGLLFSFHYFITDNVTVGIKSFLVSSLLSSIAFGAICFFLIYDGIKGVKKVIIEEKRLNERINKQ